MSGTSPHTVVEERVVSGPTGDLPMPPRIVLAPDSFKECLTARQACEALAEGIRASLPDAEIVMVPMADGGEGTVQSLVDATGGRLVEVSVEGPLGDPVTASYGLLGPDHTTAVLEMAEASGIGLVPAAGRDVRRASTRGTGQLLRAALDAGVRHVVLGIGGSATNDGGAGMVQVLGARLLDAEGAELAPGGAELARLDRIDVTALDPRLAQTTIEVACDVTNPLCGPQGASAVYGPQKGADAAAVAELDAALARWAQVVHADLGRDVADVPGAGAAGGLGAGLLAFTNATLTSGIELVVRHAHLADAVRGATLVVTGEGRVDGQTRFGKTPMGVAQVAAAAGVPTIAVAGSLGEGADDLVDVFEAVIPVLSRLSTLDEALADGATNLTRTGRTIGALLAVGQGHSGSVHRHGAGATA